MQERGEKSMKMARQGTYEKKKVKKFFTAGHHIVLPLTAATAWQMMVLVKTLCLIRLTGCCNLDFVYVGLYTTLPALKKRKKYHLYRNSLRKYNSVIIGSLLSCYYYLPSPWLCMLYEHKKQFLKNLHIDNVFP